MSGPTAPPDLMVDGTGDGDAAFGNAVISALRVDDPV